MTERDGAVCKSENVRTARASFYDNARPTVTRVPPVKVILIIVLNGSRILVVYAVFFLFSLSG